MIWIHRPIVITSQELKEERDALGQYLYNTSFL